MSLDAPYPDLDEFVTAIGDAGARLSEIGASEGAAGNISVCIGWHIEPRRKFPVAERIKLPLEVPGLANHCVNYFRVRTASARNSARTRSLIWDA